ncbi:MAG: hypothetical protein Pg6B_10650 [Candidatus Azobacteroides pseudotrichonymphae]|nr:MAG: hypothetical protein Pg6B_10650 [Candidatus Azobacteroides pseudotrichonymphae]
MKKPLFLFYSLMLLLVTVSVSSCKKGCDSDSTEHCIIYFKDGTKKEFDIDSKYQLNCGLERYDSYPGTFHIYLNYIYQPKKKGEETGEWKSGGEDPFYTGNRCCIIGKKNVTEEGCLKEMKRLAEEIGEGRMVEDGWYGDRNTLRFGSLKNVIGYSYRFKNNEQTIRLLPNTGPATIEYYTIFFKDGTKKEFSIESKYKLHCILEKDEEIPNDGYGYDIGNPEQCISIGADYDDACIRSGSEYNDYNDYDDDYTGTHITTFDICLYYTYDKDRYEYYCFIDDEKTTADGCLKEIKRLSKEIGDGKVEKHHDYGSNYTLSIPSLENVIG